MDTPKKESFINQKNEKKDNINNLNDLNIKLSSNNNFPNKCKTINYILGINNNNNKSNNNPLKIKDNKVVSKVNNNSSNVSNNNKINDDDDDNNNGNIDNNNNNNNNNKYKINENDNDLPTNDYEKSNHDNTNNKGANNKSKSNFKINTRKKSIYIVGGSLVKKLNGFELSKSIKGKCSVRVRFNLSTKTSCINDHVKLVIRNQEADLSSDITPVQIFNDIVNLAALIKDKSIKVKIFELVERNDALNKKVVLVNEYLSKICKTIGLPIIKHHNINPEFHLNQSKLHLNKKYNTIFVSNFRKYLNNFN